MVRPPNASRYRTRAGVSLAILFYLLRGLHTENFRYPIQGLLSAVDDYLSE